MHTHHIYVYDGDTGEFLRKEESTAYEFKPRAAELAQAGYGIKVIGCYDGAVVFTLDPMPQ